MQYILHPNRRSGPFHVMSRHSAIEIEPRHPTPSASPSSMQSPPGRGLTSPHVASLALEGTASHDTLSSHEPSGPSCCRPACLTPGAPWSWVRRTNAFGDDEGIEDGM